MPEKPMTTEEFHSITSDMGWNLSDLARAAKRDFSRIKKMASGRQPIDGDLALWLRSLSQFHHHLLDNPTYVELIRLRRAVAAMRRQMSEMQPKLGESPTYQDLMQLIDEGVPIKRP